MDKTNKKDALNYYSELRPVINIKTSSNHRLMESFRFWDEDDYGEYEIFSILSEPAREPAGKRDNRRHSTKSFRANVKVAGTSY